MIVTRTPYRVSFFGGGTDYPQWYRHEGGAVLSTSIARHLYLTVRWLPAFDQLRHRVVWSHLESVSSRTEILHPAVREGMRWLGFGDDRGVEIHHQGDLPARAGIGSSSAFSVGLLHALCALRGERPDASRLARMAIEFEQEVLAENVGSQDQVAVAHGGFNRIRFEPDGQIVVEPVRIGRERRRELASRLQICFVGASRLGSEVAASLVEDLGRRHTQLRGLRELVDRACESLERGEDLDAFGHLLHESWMLKRELSAAVSNSAIDSIYDLALKHGALGGKLLGAGRTGFMVFYVPPERADEASEALARWPSIPFDFEDRGSELLLGVDAA